MYICVSSIDESICPTVTPLLFFKAYCLKAGLEDKIYFTEVGVAAYLLGLEEEGQVDRDPLRGQLFENLVVSEALKARLNRNKGSEGLFFMRTEKGVEVDVVLRTGTTLRPFEIKSAMTPNHSFAKSLEAFCDAEATSDTPTVIYSGDSYPSFRGIRYVNYKDCYRCFE